MIAPMRLRRLALGIACLMLVIGSVLVFVAFDSHSHSVSDTIRPFVIAMAPIWAGFGLAIWAATRGRSGGRDGD